MHLASRGLVPVFSTPDSAQEVRGQIRAHVLEVWFGYDANPDSFPLFLPEVEFAVPESSSFEAGVCMITGW